MSTSRIVAFCLMLCLAIPTPAFAAPKTKKKTAVKRSAPVEKPYQPGPNDLLPASAPSTKAKACVVIDARTGELLMAKNPDARRAPASTLKLMTALIVAETGQLDKPIIVVPSDTYAEPTKLGFKAGDVYTRRQLLQILLVHSMNDAACALARDNAGSVTAFALKMNAKARELGMSSSNFINPNGLPAQGQYSTARDMAKVARAAYSNFTIRQIVAMKSLDFRYVDGRVREFKNTNKVLRAASFCNGMKTGYTFAAGKCLIASGSQNGRDVIAVSLGSTSDRIWKDSYNLLAWALAL